jgi:hypothetical protein
MLKKVMSKVDDLRRVDDYQVKELADVAIKKLPPGRTVK